MNENYIDLFQKFTNTDDFSEVSLLGEVASALILNQLFDEFEKILSNIDVQKLLVLKKNEKFLRATIAYYYEKKCYPQVIQLLETGEFSDHAGLIDIWDGAHYAQKEIQLERPLTPLIKFRTRQKFPPPKSISPTGERATKKLSDDAKCILKAWMSKNSHNPYPSQETREELANKANMTQYQVKTWFANARRRQKLNVEKTLEMDKQYVKKREDLLSQQTRDDREFQVDSNVRHFNQMSSSTFLANHVGESRNSEATIDQSTASESKSETLDIRGSSWFNISPSSLIFDKNNNISANKNLPVSCGNSTNQDHHHCLQYLEQLCRNITNRDVPRCTYNNQKIESTFMPSCTQYPLCGIRYNDHQSYHSRCDTDNYRQITGPENRVHPYNQYQHQAALCKQDIFNRCEAVQYQNHNAYPSRPNVAITNPTNLGLSRQQSQYFPYSILPPNQNGVLSRTYAPQSVITNQYGPMQSQSCARISNHPETMLYATDENQPTHPWYSSDLPNNKGFFGSVPERRCTLECCNDIKTSIQSRPSSCPLPTTPLGSSHTGGSKILTSLIADNQQQRYQKTFESLPQCTEEQDVAKVLLDLSSQHSSQESS